MDTKVTEDVLNFRNLILSTQLEASMDGILVVNRKREWISYNQRFLEMWQIPSEVAASKNSRLALEGVRNLVTEPEYFLERIEELYANEATRSQEEIELRDGRVLDRYSAPMVAGNRYFGRVWFYRDLTDQKLAERSLRQSEEKLRFLTRRLVKIQEQERRNLARELHDEVGQFLTGIKLILGTVKRMPARNIKESLSQAEVEINELMDKIRELSLDLRPAMLDDLGLLPTLRWHFKRFSKQTGIELEFLHSGIADRHDPEIELGAYRVVQEGLTNIARHAEATIAAVHIHVMDRRLEIRIEDEGVGFDKEDRLARPDTSGILGMSERVSLLGGELSLSSAPGEGTQLTVVGDIHLTGVTICSVHGVSSRWQALPGLGWRVSSLVSNRCGLPGLPRMAAVARRLRLSELRPRRRLALGRWPLHVSGVFDTQFGDGRYDLRSDADTLDDMVHRLLAVRHR